jgi:hypothetical protein
MVQLQAKTRCGTQRRSGVTAAALLYSCDGKKLLRGHTSGSFIGVRVLVHAERYPKSIVQLNRRLLQNLLRIQLDSVLDANSQRPRDKTLGTSRSVGVLDDHGNASRCGIQMDEWHGAQVKVAADGGRQATSRGRVGIAPGYAGVTS